MVFEAPETFLYLRCHFPAIAITLASIGRVHRVAGLGRVYPHHWHIFGRDHFRLDHLPWPIQTVTIVEAERLRGEGEAEAIRIYAEALSQDLDFYTFSRRLEAYDTVLKRGDLMVVPVDSEFFRFLITHEVQPSAPGFSHLD